MRLIHGILIAVLILASAAFETPARAQTADPGTGVVLDDGASGGPQPQVTCTLTVTPNVVTNGQVFTVQVNYSPSIGPGSWTEKFTFNWPSISPNFDEKTVRSKMFINFSGVSGSLETEVAPTATNINGTFPVKVKVTGVSSCSASANLTVQ